jgi:hypothetical protein
MIVLKQVTQDVTLKLKSLTLEYMLKLQNGYPFLILFSFFLFASCSKDDEIISIDRSALLGTWVGNNYDCLFDKPGAVSLAITKGPDPLGLKLNLNNGEHVIDADYGKDDDTRAFVGEYETSSYSIIISGILYDDGVMKLSVWFDEDICDATLTKQ